MFISFCALGFFDHMGSLKALYSFICWKKTHIRTKPLPPNQTVNVWRQNSSAKANPSLTWSERQWTPLQLAQQQGAAKPTQRLLTGYLTPSLFWQGMTLQFFGHNMGWNKSKRSSKYAVNGWEIPPNPFWSRLISSRKEVIINQRFLTSL